MPPLPDAARTLRSSLRGARMLALSGAVAASYRVSRTVAPGAGLEPITKARLGRAVLRGAGFSWEVHGRIPVDRRPRLVVANHRSAFDIALMLAIAPDPVMVSRGDVADWPVLGPLARYGDTLFVDRADRANGARIIREMRRAMAAGRTVVVFPEGTTHAEEDLRAFQAGAFAAAKGLDVEFVPVGIAYARGLEFVQPSMAAHVGHVLSRDDLRLVATVGSPTTLPAGPTTKIADEARARVAALATQAASRVR